MDYCHKFCAKTIFEWPTNNLYWKEKKVREYFDQCKWTKHNVHGCSYGLASSVNPERPIKKPWSLVTDFPTLSMAKRCTCYVPTPGAVHLA